MTGLSKPSLYWIPSSGIWWIVACYKFASVSEESAAYVSEESPASVFVNCTQHDPTECTQISNSLHGVLYQECGSYVVLSAAWIFVIIISDLKLSQFSSIVWNTVISYSRIADLINHTFFVISVNRDFMFTRERERNCCELNSLMRHLTGKQL